MGPLDRLYHPLFFLFLHENICCGYSLEAPWQGASNEHPQYMFSWRIRKIFKWILLLSVAMLLP